MDASWAWYFAPRSIVPVTLFHPKIDGCVKTGATGAATVDLLHPRDQTVKTFAISSASPRTSAAPRPGATTAARWWAVGMHGKLGVYFENDQVSTRLVANYHGDYVSSTTAPSPTANSQQPTARATR